MSDLTPTKKELTKEEAESFFGELFYGKHHAPPVKPFGRGWRVSCYDDRLATWDFNYLTRLVFLAHDKCIRAQLLQGGPGRIGIAIWKRQGRVGSSMETHPTIEKALSDWRLNHQGEQA